ncbi:helix-turn-helix domain-containing protein, partial [Streptomyces erythrochromogenes]|uniref:helix-turn-helix domain-containing protein n=1 Tax=Streptomyces erythrochromogenes TaxID=285574 RepID=UPI0036A839D9
MFCRTEHVCGSWIELLGCQAADLFEQGVRQSKVAQVLGVTPQAVSLWRRA